MIKYKFMGVIIALIRDRYHCSIVEDVEVERGYSVVLLANRLLDLVYLPLKLANGR